MGMLVPGSLEDYTVAALRMLLLIEAVTSTVLHDVIVNTKYGRLKGTRHKEVFDLGPGGSIHSYDKFLGVPYAKPPIGQRRFKPPEPPDQWYDVKDARDYGSVCPQMVFHADTGEEFQNEDCLNLNIYAPYQEECHQGTETSKSYPVLVYIHGGSYEVGTGKQYDGSVLAHFGVVVVTINYRLGALGFLTSGDEFINGNYGLLDQIEALKWVSENIGSFRGDPNKVTVFGHSAGGASVGLLLVIPQTDNLFQGVIAMSGAATASYSVYEPHIDHRQYIRQVAALFNCPTNANFSESVECLRRVPADSFKDKRQQFPRYDPIDPEFRPYMDGTYITASPRELFAQGKFKDVPVIVGTIDNEFGNYFNGGDRANGNFEEALDKYLLSFVGNPSIREIVEHDYTHWHKHPVLYDRGELLSDMHMIAPTVDMSDLITRYSHKLYQYHFAVEKGYHSIELNYVFGAPFSGRFADEMITNGTTALFSEEQRKLSIKMMTAWTNFAKTGMPLLETLQDDLSKCNLKASPAPSTDVAWDMSDYWLPYTLPYRDYLHLGLHHIEMRKNLRAEKVAFWNNLIPKLKGQPPLGAYSTANVGEVRSPEAPSISLWVFLTITAILLALVLLLTVLFVKSTLRHQRFQRSLQVYEGANNISPARV